MGGFPSALHAERMERTILVDLYRDNRASAYLNAAPMGKLTRVYYEYLWALASVDIVVT